MGIKVTRVPQLSNAKGVKSAEREVDSASSRHQLLVGVKRRYEPEPGALEELIDVLYKLLTVDEPPPGRYRNSQLAFHPEPSEECV